MKQLFYTVLFMLTGIVTFGQQFGNEWIVPGQKYYKINVAHDGIYRISDEALDASGIIIDAFDKRLFYIIHNNHEIPIHFEYDQFNFVEYLEFYGEKNDGSLDTGLVLNNLPQANPYYSLFNDTAAYFLTWDSSINHLRMADGNDNTSNAESPYCFYTALVQYTSTYNPAMSQDVRYTGGEGWSDDSYCSLTTPLDKNISTPEIYSGYPDAKISFGVVAVSTLNNHHINVKLNNVQISDNVYTGYGPYQPNISISTSLLSTFNNVRFSSVNDLGLSGDKSSPCYISIRYPRNYSFQNNNSVKFDVPAGSQTSKLSISDFDGGAEPVLYDLTNNQRMTPVLNGGVWQTVIDNSVEEVEVYMCSDEAVFNISNELQEISFINFQETDFNSEYIIISHPDVWSGAEAYRDFRADSFEVMLVNVEDLYDQFYYGIRKHPMAIRNFMKYLINIYDETPKYLFIIGKGRHANETRKTVGAFNDNLVPSMGVSSDLLFTVGLGDAGDEPAVPTGRLSTLDTDDVFTYRDKAEAFESNEPAAWMKRVLHFGGGSSTGEQEDFANYLAAYQDIIEDTLFGAKVYPFLKVSSDVLTVNESSTISDLINGGVSLMTFFGHGASTIGFDHNIDEPNAFENYDKYPLIYANSCYVGDIFLGAEGISEQWVFHERGAIAFFASGGLSQAYNLNRISTEFYKNLTYKNYGKGIGDVYQQTIHHMQNNNISDYAVYEFVLHGDPAIVLNGFDLPDLMVSNQEFKFTPAMVSTEIDTFDFSFVITNASRAVDTAFLVTLERTYPDGTTHLEQFELPRCYYKDTINVRLPVDRINGTGLNSIRVFADADFSVEEYSEDNNSAILEFIIVSEDLIPIWPYQYAIYPDSRVTLVASTGNLFATDQNCVFEIDTTDLFVNPLLASSPISYDGGVVSWEVPFTLHDSVVYFWRVSNVPEVTSQEYHWRESSFIYIPEKTGWSQDHFFQFKNDEYTDIVYNRNNRSFDFVNSTKDLICNTTGVLSTYGLNINYFLNGYSAYGGCNIHGTIHVVIIDPVTLIPWRSDKANYGHNNFPQCGSQAPKHFFIFGSNEAGRASLADMLNNDVPNNYHVLIYTFDNVHFDLWEPELFQAIDDLVTPGIQIEDNASPFRSHLPYIFFGQKGTSNFEEKFAGDVTDKLKLQQGLIYNQNRGHVVSEIIGPSTGWNKLYWNQDAEEKPSDDYTMLTVKGIGASGAETVLIDSLSVNQKEVFYLDSICDANEYPYLKLDLFTRDISIRTPSQLDKWQVYYDEAPETALNPAHGLYFSSDTVQEGDYVGFSIATENISPYNMDSLLVSYVHIDRNNNEHILATKRMRPHPAGDILILDTVSVNTLGYAGLNSLWIEVNPIDSATGQYDQIERYHFNNIASKFFYVHADNTNPLLDVTFDGLHILNGDIVSSGPEILIRLKDENKFLELNDPALFQLYITAPGGIEEPVNLVDINGNEQLKWIPAQLPDNSCEILYSPEFTVDGIYKLRVRAVDASNNESGAEDYMTTFEVITESTITDVFNYPNPFSTSTRFVFELTGSELPDDFRIQIMTITGKLVKVIDMDDLGSIHIGRNITEYAWDGRDTYGDQLANGVYFYRIITSIDGESIEKRQTGAEKYFRKGMGKMFLMR